MTRACDEIDRRKHETFLSTIKTSFDCVKDLQLIVNYQDSERKVPADTPVRDMPFTICMTGEIGAGKSSTNNHVMYAHCQEHGIDHKSHLFAFGAQVERVTRNCCVKQIEHMILVDTPGVNDFKNALSNNTIAKMQYDTLGALFRDPE